MAKKTNKKISITQIDKLIKSRAKNPEIILFEIDGENIEIAVNPNITFSERSQLVMDISDMCFNVNGYHPEGFDFAYASQMILTFTNINPEISIDKLWDLYRNTDIIFQIETLIEDHSIKIEAKEMIEFNKNIILKQSKVEDLAGSLLGLANSFEGLVDKINAIPVDTFKDFDIEKVTSALGKISSVDDKSILNADIDFDGVEKEFNV